MALYTNDRGAQVKGPLLKKGNAVAILYPEKHYFIDGSTGVRVEEDDMIKVLTATSIMATVGLSHVVAWSPSLERRHSTMVKE